MNKKLNIENSFKINKISRETINNLIPYLNKHRKILNVCFRDRKDNNFDYNFKSALELLNKIYMNWNESAITGDKETINKKTKQFNNYILSNPNLKNIDFFNYCDELDYKKIDYKQYQFTDDKEEENLNFLDLDEEDKGPIISNNIKYATLEDINIQVKNNEETKKKKEEEIKLYLEEHKEALLNLKNCCLCGIEYNNICMCKNPILEHQERKKLYCLHCSNFWCGCFDY